ncbi:MAG: phycocyanin alpha phycocyanobilin lyase-like protein [Chloroflexi bacterium OLB15]|nr:MAG: phycocyanin alpha phycocyanobilin lyase-like protein [Chloroflexi bacterium OLB15]
MPEFELEDENFSEIRQRPEISETLKVLEGLTEPTSSAISYGLTDLSADELAVLLPVWAGLDAEYRRSVVKALVDVTETNIEFNYSALAEAALNDADDGVREAAIELLWEDESIALMDRLIEISLHDDAVLVRAAAANALGRFILSGELGDIPEEQTERARQAAIALWENPDEDVEVRRRALEAISNSSHDIVPEAIEQAYQSHDQRMQTSAIFAMGRSCDDRWAGHVLSELENESPEFRYEAARAAGELELEEAIPALSGLAFDRDVDIRDVAIWALGEIGGKEAVRVLTLLVNDAKSQGDRDLSESIEDALAAATLNSGDLYMMRFDD